MPGRGPPERASDIQPIGPPSSRRHSACWKTVVSDRTWGPAEPAFGRSGYSRQVGVGAPRTMAKKAASAALQPLIEEFCQVSQGLWSEASRKKHRADFQRYVEFLVRTGRPLTVESWTWRRCSPTSRSCPQRPSHTASGAAIGPPSRPPLSAPRPARRARATPSTRTCGRSAPFERSPPSGTTGRSLRMWLYVTFTPDIRQREIFARFDVNGPEVVAVHPRPNEKPGCSGSWRSVRTGCRRNE